MATTQDAKAIKVLCNGILKTSTIGQNEPMKVAARQALKEVK